MKIRELVRHWEHTAKGRMARNHYSIPLDVESAARLAALHEMYPRRSVEELLGELVGAALEELEASFPYVKGSQVVATDEQGDRSMRMSALPHASCRSRASTCTNWSRNKTPPVTERDFSHAGGARRERACARPRRIPRG